MIQPAPTFKENLQKLPPIDGIKSLEIVDAAGDVVAVIENQQGKQGSLAVYQYLFQTFGSLTQDAAAHGLAVFAEHTADARNRPGAHPNIDRLFEIENGAASFEMRLLKD